MAKASENTTNHLLETLAQLLIPNGIYRVQRNGLATYPNELPDNSKDVVEELYQTFEQIWEDTYDNNPYAFMTNGQRINGENSELTFHFNPLEGMIYINYNIQSEDPNMDAIGYPLTIPMTKTLRDRPLTDSLLFLEALGQKEHIDCFYSGNILYYKKEYPVVSIVWNRIKDSLMREVETGYKRTSISEDEWQAWKIGLDKNEMIVNVKDANVMNMPSISVYGDDAKVDGKEYATQATIGLIEAAFMFRHDRYTAFSELI